jgi:hypothetical protein
MFSSINSRALKKTLDARSLKGLGQLSLIKPTNSILKKTVKFESPRSFIDFESISNKKK